MMRHVILAVGLAAVMAGASAAEARTACDSYAHNKRVQGTAVGALGGGLLGAAVAGHGDKGTGALVGAGLGAVVGNQVSRVKCNTGARHRVARRASTTRSAAVSCHTTYRTYYDAAGRPVQTPVRTC